MSMNAGYNNHNSYPQNQNYHNNNTTYSVTPTFARYSRPNVTNTHVNYQPNYRLYDPTFTNNQVNLEQDFNRYAPRYVTNEYNYRLPDQNSYRPIHEYNQYNSLLGGYNHGHPAGGGGAYGYNKSIGG